MSSGLASAELRPVRAACLGLALLLAAAAAGRAEEATPAAEREEWYRLELAGQPAGYLLERELQGAGGAITSETVMDISLSRGATDLRLRFETRFVETAEGHPLRVEVRQEMGSLPVTFTWTFAADHILLTSGEGESAQEKKLPLPEGEWLTPAAAARRVAEQVAAGAASFRFRTLDPLTGATPVEIESTRSGEGEWAGPEGPVPASRWREVVKGAGVVESTAWRDEAGRLLESRTELLGMELRLTLSDRSGALHGERRAAELLVSTFVRPSLPIPRPRRLQRAVYRLELAGGSLGPLPSAGGQRVEALPGGSVRVTVAGSGRGAPDGAEPAGDLSPYLAATTYLDHQSPGVRRLAERALGTASAAPAGAEGRPPGEVAEALRGFVYRYITAKDLATGFATASQVVASRSGDCTEHAVLLATLLRAAGIPSRVVGGLLYVEAFAGEREIFGYHLWTQALLGGGWVDLDAMTEEPFDAAHIALVTAALDETDGLPALGAALATLIGKLQVEVEELGPAAAAGSW